FVDEKADTGPIIMQKAVEVFSDDTPQTLAARVLKIEHEILPEVVSKMAEEKIIVDGRRVTILE
ncbi:MAG: formyltransferase family protein, partial [Christensenellaceae bacterium]